MERTMAYLIILIAIASSRPAHILHIALELFNFALKLFNLLLGAL